MNQQKAPNGIEWTRVRLPDGSRSRGYTWNVMGGCMHACQWQMPDGKVAGCYAKDVAEGLARAASPEGFEHHYFHPERLNEPLGVKEPAGIFLDSMADLMGHWVTEDQIQVVLDTCAKAHWHTFFLLTKNAPRLDKFDFPPNVWVGASSPPDWMFGKRLTRHQQEQMFHRTLKTMQNVKARVRWISFEPLSWDCSEIVKQYPGALTWAVIGAASNGREEFPPAETDLTAMLKVLDAQGVPLFYKGNMRSLPMTAGDWREEFPDALFKARGIVQINPKPYTAYETPLPDTDMPWPEYVPPAAPEPTKPTFKRGDKVVVGYNPAVGEVTGIGDISRHEGQVCVTRPNPNTPGVNMTHWVNAEKVHHAPDKNPDPAPPAKKPFDFRLKGFFQGHWHIKRQGVESSLCGIDWYGLGIHDIEPTCSVCIAIDEGRVDESGRMKLLGEKPAEAQQAEVEKPVESGELQQLSLFS